MSKKQKMEEQFVREMTALEARAEAQRLVFAPFMFQAARVLVLSGLLDKIKVAGQLGLSLLEIRDFSPLSPYAVKILVEAGLACGILSLSDERYSCTKIGWFLLKDELTKVNMNFTHSVCYKGLFHLKEALETGAPAGLKELGDWTTVYEGLSELPEDIRRDWFAFDHYYSDKAFEWALPIVFESAPKMLLDIGGNTGKFGAACAEYNPDVRIAICDLPGQLRQAKANLAEKDLLGRVDFFEVDLLDRESSLPKGGDTAWMSQFLCCFSEDEIVSILKRAGVAVGPRGRIFIMDTFWDKQEHVAAAYSLIAISLYFTAIANGNSRMYGIDDVLHCIEKAGLEVMKENNNSTTGHTLLCCRVKS